MPRWKWFAVACLYALLPRPAGASEEYAFHHESVMGTSLELRVRADSPADASAAEARALAEVDRLARALSGYDPSSALRRWQDGPPGAAVPVPPELSEVLAACDRWRQATGGAFDPRAAALTRLWSACEARGRAPDDGELAAAVARASRPAWRLDPSAGTAQRLTDVPVALDGIAKGYVVGRAASAAYAPGRGVRGVLLNVGGDMRVCGEADWRVGVADPRSDSETSAPLTSLRVRDVAISTSGRSQRGFRVGGRWYSHILDPRTGRPADRTASATVIAADSADADALATAFNVLSVGESLALVKSVAGVECLLVGTDGRVTRSPGWGRYEAPAPPLALAAADAGVTWDTDHELLIKFELGNPPSKRGFRRQYVAVWVEDAKGFPVRTLTLWGRGRWVADLKQWSRSDKARRLVDPTDLREAVSRPTRPPGKYEVIWDGKDDHGKRLDAGEYTVSIEAAREHGTYQSISTKVNVAGKPFSEELKGNVEIRSASVEYRRKGQGE